MTEAPHIEGFAVRPLEARDKARWLYATEGFVFEAMREVDPAVNRMVRTLVLARAL